MSWTLRLAFIDARASSWKAWSGVSLWRSMSTPLASSICVELAPTFAGDAVHLRIVDDGRGLGDGRKGAGVRGMREGAVLVGATLTLGSHQEGGTELRLLVPVPRRGDRP